MRSYRILEGVVFSGGLAVPGDIHDIPDDEAADLLADGLIEDLAAAVPSSLVDAGAGTRDQNPAPAPADQMERLVAIAEAIEVLYPRSDLDWTKSGKPRVEAIESIVGFDINMAERNQVWAEIVEATERSTPEE